MSYLEDTPLLDPLSGELRTRLKSKASSLFFQTRYDKCTSTLELQGCCDFYVSGTISGCPSIIPPVFGSALPLVPYKNKNPVSVSKQFVIPASFGTAYLAPAQCHPNNTGLHEQIPVWDTPRVQGEMSGLRREGATK